MEVWKLRSKKGPEDRSSEGCFLWRKGKTVEERLGKGKGLDSKNVTETLRLLKDGESKRGGGLEFLKKKAQQESASTIGTGHPQR